MRVRFGAAAALLGVVVCSAGTGCLASQHKSGGASQPCDCACPQPDLGWTSTALLWCRLLLTFLAGVAAPSLFTGLVGSSNSIEGPLQDPQAPPAAPEEPIGEPVADKEPLRGKTEAKPAEVNEVNDTVPELPTSRQQGLEEASTMSVSQETQASAAAVEAAAGDKGAGGSVSKGERVKRKKSRVFRGVSFSNKTPNTDTNAEKQHAAVRVVEQSVTKIWTALSDPESAMEGIRLTGWLGKGAFSNVYRAQWGTTELALKVCKVSSRRRMERNLTMEAGIGVCARHPNVVTTYFYTLNLVKKAQPEPEHGKSCRRISLQDAVEELEGKKEKAQEEPEAELWEIRLLQECCDLGTLRSAVKRRNLSKQGIQTDESPESPDQQEPPQLQSYGNCPAPRTNTARRQMLTGSQSTSSKELSWASLGQQQAGGLPSPKEETSGRGIQSLQQVNNLSQRQGFHGALAVMTSGPSAASLASEEGFNSEREVQPSPGRSGELAPDLEFRMDERMPDHEKQKQKLRHRGQENPQDLAAVLSLAADVVEGMAYLHSKGVIHGDLKTANILLKTVTIEGAARVIAKVADFGTSVLLQGDTEVKSFFAGTPSYMAPEVLASSTVCKASDVYSFGIMLYELATGEKPYPNYSTKEIMYQVVHYKLRPQIVLNLPRPLIHLMTQCWQQDTAKRPSFNDIRLSLQELRQQIVGNTLACRSWGTDLSVRNSVSVAANLGGGEGRGRTLPSRNFSASQIPRRTNMHTQPGTGHSLHSLQESGPVPSEVSVEPTNNPNQTAAAAAAPGGGGGGSPVDGDSVRVAASVAGPVRTGIRDMRVSDELPRPSFLPPQRLGGSGESGSSPTAPRNTALAASATEALALQAPQPVEQELRHRRASESVTIGGKKKLKGRHTFRIIKRSLSKLSLFGRSGRASNTDAPTVYEDEPIEVQRSCSSYNFSNLARAATSPPLVAHSSDSNVGETQFSPRDHTSGRSLVPRAEPPVPQEGAPRPQQQQQQQQQPQVREPRPVAPQRPVSPLSAPARSLVEDRLAESKQAPALGSPPRSKSRLSGGGEAAAAAAAPVQSIQSRATSMDGSSRRTSKTSTSQTIGRSSVDLSRSVALCAARERDSFGQGGSEGRPRRGSLDSSVQNFRMQHGRHQGQENDGSNPGLANVVKTLLGEDKVSERQGRSSLELERPTEGPEVPRGPVGVLVPKWDGGSSSAVRLKPAGSYNGSSRRASRASALDSAYARRVSRVSADSAASATPLWLSQSFDVTDQDQVLYVAGKTREKQPTDVREAEASKETMEEEEDDDEESDSESTVVFKQKPSTERAGE